MWPRVRPWLGLGLALYETAQPLFGRPVEVAIVSVAGTMMAAELAAKALKRSEERDEEK